MRHQTLFHFVTFTAFVLLVVPTGTTIEKFSFNSANSSVLGKAV